MRMVEAGNERDGRSARGALIAPLDFDVDGRERSVRAALIGLVALTAFAIVVLAVAPMREVAVAVGAVRSGAPVVELRHGDGGEVERLLAAPGALVAEGDPLVQFRTQRIAADLAQLETRRAHAALRAAALGALIREAPFEPPPDLRLARDAIATEAAFVERQQAARDARLAAFDARAAQRVETGAADREEAIGLERQADAHAERAAMVSALFDRGAAARAQVVEATARVSEARARAAQARGAAASVAGALAEIASDRAQYLATVQGDWSREHADTLGQIAELDRLIAKEADRLARATVRAPVRGLVQDLGGLTPGGATGPGGLVARIVPLEGALIAEVRIAPSDIGHIVVGDEADIHVSTFDPSRFGAIRGVVSRLSPTADTAEDGARYFTAELTLDRTHGLSDPRLTLGPGMEVRAEIRTGAKSVLRYLFKPVANALDHAFVER